MNWYTSDLHIGHEDTIRYNRRPFKDLNEMHEELIRHWNNAVKPNDTIYVMGDLALCSYKELEPIVRRLNGNKVLILGNHDHLSVSQYERLGFKVYRELKFTIAGKPVRLCHFPYALPWYRRLFAYKSELRYMDQRPPRVKGEFLIHGHVHMKYKRVDNRLHVGVDAWNFRPVSESQLESLMTKPQEKSHGNRIQAIFPRH
jgi:calcineurin-like phosphoesterase family protein